MFQPAPLRTSGCPLTAGPPIRQTPDHTQNVQQVPRKCGCSASMTAKPPQPFDLQPGGCTGFCKLAGDGFRELWAVGQCSADLLRIRSNQVRIWSNQPHISPNIQASGPTWAETPSRLAEPARIWSNTPHTAQARPILGPTGPKFGRASPEVGRTRPISGGTWLDPAPDLDPFPKWVDPAPA